MGLTCGCCRLVLRPLFRFLCHTSYSQCRRNFLVLKCTFWVKFCAAYIIPHPRNLKIAHFTQHHVDQLVMDTTSLELIQSRFPGERNHVTLLNRHIRWKRKVSSCANPGLLAWTATELCDHLATNGPQNPLYALGLIPGDCQLFTLLCFHHKMSTFPADGRCSKRA